ncbi:MAG: cation:proton antiporter, partial [Gammaproteobacteria bacterium]|nr:cation:proton antiporter [Gammaproteobacteria bacterium]
MEAHTFFLYLLVILLTARLFAEIAVRLQSPSVIGELFAGIVIGPSLFGWIEPVEALKLMAEIGIILLLFEVGLSTDIKRLIRSGTKSTLVAVTGFIATLIFGYIIGHWFIGLTLLESLFIGG